jgi:hypothetical protein
MKPELNLTNEEKEKIKTWKESLPKNPNRRFIYAFVEIGRFDNNGNWIEWAFAIKSIPEGHKLKVANNVQLN